ncbi:CGNR zinc finger domain-containing protein [Microlunatus flavus]|uniref:CGNR zinc finger domain-containing protein n=1 Tax=Microlunatus flavus TaxID=1036181 RepID=A0A1H9L5R4_9ACTN|nr:CGNR zinc finger domain-containing protein [Microlunatus flavus]SER06841.1 CGNR zinc finger domain-containing protein [Microlunatus flavus]
MGVLSEYSDEGLLLAVALANAGSACRRGDVAQPGLPINGVVVRTEGAEELALAAAQVREILAAPTPGRAAELINRLLVAQQARPELAPDQDGRWRLHLHPRGASAAALDLVKAATGLAVLVDEGRWGTIRACGAERCDDLFLDQSRNLIRRYCSRVCANRVNAALHRRRAASEP